GGHASLRAEQWFVAKALWRRYGDSREEDPVGWAGSGSDRSDAGELQGASDERDVAEQRRCMAAAGDRIQAGTAPRSQLAGSCEAQSQRDARASASGNERRVGATGQDAVRIRETGVRRGCLGDLRGGGERSAAGAASAAGWSGIRAADCQRKRDESAAGKSGEA